MDRFISWIWVINFDQEILHDVLDRFFFGIQQIFLLAVWLIIHQDCRMLLYQLVFITEDFASRLHDERRTALIVFVISLEIPIFVIEKCNFEVFDKLVEGSCLHPMLLKVDEFLCWGFPLWLQRFFSIAKQIIHLPFSKLQKAELYLAFVVRLFVLLIEESKADDEEDSRVCLQTNWCFQSRLRVDWGKDDELIDLIFHICDEAAWESLEKFWVGPRWANAILYFYIAYLISSLN